MGFSDFKFNIWIISGDPVTPMKHINMIIIEKNPKSIM